MVKPCGNCGVAFDGADDCDFCVPCDLAVKAKEPPKDLLDMEHVYSDLAAVTPGQRFMKGLKDQDPHRFLDKMQKARDGYRAHLRGLEKTKGPEAGDKASEPQAVDEGSERVEELCLKILAQARKDAGLPPLEAP